VSPPPRRAEKLIRGGIAVFILAECTAATFYFLLENRPMALIEALLGVYVGALLVHKGRSLRKIL
jgi:hypothetical protein